jgi:LAGLIDADG DNA endonuclease family
MAFLLKDDGGRQSEYKSVRISTDNFTLQEFELIRDTFKAKFNLASLY